MKKVNCDIQKQIVNDYEKNVSNKTLTEKYSLHRSTIQAIIKYTKNINPSSPLAM